MLKNCSLYIYAYKEALVLPQESYYAHTMLLNFNQRMCCDLAFKCH